MVRAAEWVGFHRSFPRSMGVGGGNQILHARDDFGNWER